jgi:hypothetical protein
MSEPLRFPVRSREDPLSALGDLAREALIDPTEREVVREVGLRLAADGAETVGDALDALEQAGPAGRRRLVDEARVAVGLPDIETERVHAQLKRANAALRPGRDSQGRSIQQCPAPGCGAVSSGRGGLPEPVADRRWWCVEHRDQAAPGDLDPIAPRYIISPTGRPVAVGEERERFVREETRRLEEEAERTRQREAEEAAISAARERYEAENEGIDVMGVPASRVRKV